jgi:tetratricopeptide (TPR) repeat protein
VEENFKKISQSGGITSVYNNGVFLSKQQKYPEALAIFKSLVERLHNQYDEPLLLLSHVNQGVLYEKMNNFDMAI